MTRKPRTTKAKVVRAWCCVENGKLRPALTFTQRSYLEGWTDYPDRRIARVEIREISKPRKKVRKP